MHKIPPTPKGFEVISDFVLGSFLNEVDVLSKIFINDYKATPDELAAALRLYVNHLETKQGKMESMGGI